MRSSCECKRKETNSWFAISSVCLSVLGIVIFVLTIPLNIDKGFEISEIVLLFSLLLSIIVLVVRAKNNQLKDSGFVIMAILLTIPCVFFADTFRTLPERRRLRTPEWNMRILEKTIKEYAKTNGGSLPSAGNWRDELMKFNPNLSKDNFEHPRIDGAVIVFNKNLSNSKLESLPDDIVLLFVAYAGWNLSDAQELFHQREKELSSKAYTDEDIVKKPCMSDVLLLNGQFIYYWSGKGYKDYSGKNFKLLRWEP